MQVLLISPRLHCRIVLDYGDINAHVISNLHKNANASIYHHAHGAVQSGMALVGDCHWSAATAENLKSVGQLMWENH